MSAPAKNPVFCAIDTNDLSKAVDFAQTLRGHVGGVKLGLEFFLAHGKEGYRAVQETGAQIFLDLKLHDIPNTVGGAIGSLLPLAPAFLTLHASGGGAMLCAAAEAAAKAGAVRPKLLAVTVLTSLDGKDLAEVGQGSDTAQQALRLARLARESGCDGAVCSPEEAKTLRAELGPNFILMVPGIRPVWAASNDQKRFTTPKQAIEAGATYLVIGRPITGAENPAEAAGRIARELTQ